MKAMQSLLLFTTLVVCFELHLVSYANASSTPMVTESPLFPHERLLQELLDSWENPHVALQQKINLTVTQYAYWTSLSKFVQEGKRLQSTYVKRFCKCSNPLVKRSLMTRIKRQDTDTPPKKRARQEWRRMSRQKKQSFIKHFSNLSVKRPNEAKSRLRVLADFHRQSEAAGAHKGPAFLPWHREFLYRIENALQDDGYRGGLPYWNSGLDYGLPKPEHSEIFTVRELGPSNGKLLKPFKSNTVTGDCLTASFDQTVVRFADGGNDNLLHRDKRDELPWNEDYATFASELERIHNRVHTWFGSRSHMMEFNCVGFDPIFYMHHAYIDYLWEEYRKTQSLMDRENDYPTGLGVSLYHQKFRDMKPFDDKNNIDGLKVQYTNVYYSYQKSPDKCKTDKNCKSGLLWCNNGLCQAKIKATGQCNSTLPARQCYCKKNTPVCQPGNPNTCRCS